ncbi:MAG: hypothetical protein VB084_06385 [Syntrophomonadaceae bacterium]|nr:hypothetical protein [Syntrophomonadaceae bacterium]
MPNEQGANFEARKKIVSGWVIGEYPCFYLINLGQYRDTIHKNDLKKYHILKIGKRGAGLEGQLFEEPIGVGRNVKEMS